MSEVTLPTEEQRQQAIRAVATFMPDEFPESFATHLVDEYINKGTTDDEARDAFIARHLNESSE